MGSLQAIKYTRGRLDVLDQLRLPHEHHYDEVSTCEEAFDCIKSMRVRGAPAIAIVAALALAVELHRGACSKYHLFSNKTFHALKIRRLLTSRFSYFQKQPPWRTQSHTSMPV